MNYTLHQLQIFLKIAETESITKAAGELHLTQPAVSIQLRNFQAQFDIPLTEIVGRKLHVTDFGREIAVAAEKILNEVHAINYKTLAYKGKLVGRLKVSVVSTGKYVMPYFLSGFMNQHEGVELMMDVANKSKVVESLGKNEVDFALVSVLPEKLVIEKEELLQNKLYLVGSVEKEFQKEPIDKRLLEQLPIIYREEGSGTRTVMEEFIQKNNLSIRKKLTLTSNEAVKQAVIAGLGYSIMPLIGIKNELRNNTLQIIPAGDLPVRSMWWLVWLKNKKLSPVASEYLQHLRKEKAKIIKDQFDWFEQYQ